MALLCIINTENMVPIRNIVNEIEKEKSTFLPVLFPIEEKIISNMKG